MSSDPARRWLRIGGAALALPMLILLFWVLSRAWDAAKLARGTSDLDRRIAAYQSAPWSRPVLRGEPLPGSAVDAQRDAVAALGRLDGHIFGDFATHLLTGRRPSSATHLLTGRTPSVSPAVLALAAENAEKLAALRAATQRADVGAGLDLRSWPHAATPKWAHHLHAWDLLFALATKAEPGECLRIVNDVIRLSQDASGGRDVIDLTTGSYAPRMAPAVAVPCALRATAGERAAAVQELESLITHAPSFGAAVELDRLGYGLHLRRQVDEPRPPLSANLRSWLFRRAEAIDALYVLMAIPPHGEPGKDPYPAILTSMKQERERLEDSSNVDLMFAMSSYEYLAVAAEAQARLRALAVAIAAMPEGPASPALEAARRSPAFRDPYTGGILRAEEDPAVASWFVAACGPNGKPESAAPGDDVLVMVPR